MSGAVDGQHEPTSSVSLELAPRSPHSLSPSPSLSATEIPHDEIYTFFLPGEVLYTQIPDAWLKLPQPYSMPLYEPETLECGSAYSTASTGSTSDSDSTNSSKGIVAAFRNIFRIFGNSNSNEAATKDAVKSEARPDLEGLTTLHSTDTISTQSISQSPTPSPTSSAPSSQAPDSPSTPPPLPPKLQFEYLPGTLVISNYRVLFFGPPTISPRESMDMTMGEVGTTKTIGIERLCLLDLPVGALAGTGVDRSTCWSSLHHFVGESQGLGQRDHCWAGSWDSSTRSIEPTVWKRLARHSIGQDNAPPPWRKGPGGIICLEHGRQFRGGPSGIPRLAFEFADRSRLLPIIPASYLIDPLAELLRFHILRVLRSSHASSDWVTAFLSTPQHTRILQSVSNRIAKQIIHTATSLRVTSTTASATLNALVSAVTGQHLNDTTQPSQHTDMSSKSESLNISSVVTAAFSTQLATTSTWIPIDTSKDVKSVVAPTSADMQPQECLPDPQDNAAFYGSSSFPFGHFGSRLSDQLMLSLPTLDQLHDMIDGARQMIPEETKNGGASSGNVTDLRLQPASEDLDIEESCIAGTLWGPSSGSFRSLSSLHASSAPNLSSMVPPTTPRAMSSHDNVTAETLEYSSGASPPKSPSDPDLSSSTLSTTNSHGQSPRSELRGALLNDASVQASQPPTFSRLARLALCSKVPLQAGLSPNYFLTGGFHQPVANLTQIQPVSSEPTLVSAVEMFGSSQVSFPPATASSLVSTFSSRPRSTANSATPAVSSIPSLTLSVVEVVFRSPSSIFVDSLCATLARLNRSVLPMMQPQLSQPVKDTSSDDASQPEEAKESQLSREARQVKGEDAVSTPSPSTSPVTRHAPSPIPLCFAQEHASALVSQALRCGPYTLDLRKNFGWAILDPVAEAVRTRSVTIESARSFLVDHFGFGPRLIENQVVPSESEPDSSSKPHPISHQDTPGTSAREVEYGVSSAYIEPIKDPWLVSGRVLRSDTVAQQLHSRINAAFQAATAESCQDASPSWARLRVSSANANYALCSSYPPLILAPEAVPDSKLAEAASFRTHNRLPIPTWRHPKTGALLLRASQPKTGFSTRSTSDEALVEALVTAATEVVNANDASSYSHVALYPAENAFIRSHFVSQGYSSDLIEKFISQPDLLEKLMVLGYSGSGANEDTSGNVSSTSGLTQSTLSQPRLAIFDCRDTYAAWGNAIVGGGFEKAELYCGGAMFSFLDIPNIHTVSSAAITAVAKASITTTTTTTSTTTTTTKAGVATSTTAAVAISTINTSVQPSPRSKPSVAESLVNEDALKPELHRWYDAVLAVLKGASRVASALACGTTVLVHCSDNVDRTTQVSFLAQVLLDHRFRTLNGICLLLEKEWVVFGHRFRERAGLDEYGLKNKLSPVFAQAMDCLFQLLRLFPRQFEFNEVFLIDLIHSVYSGRFGAFLFDTHQDLVRAHAHVSTLSPWSHFLSNSVRQRYLSPDYVPPETNPVILAGTSTGRLPSEDDCSTTTADVIVSDPGIYLADSHRLAFVLKREHLVPWKALLFPGWGWLGFSLTNWFERNVAAALGMSLTLKNLAEPCSSETNVVSNSSTVL